MTIAEDTDLRVTIELLRDGLLPPETYTPEAIGVAVAVAIRKAV